MSILVVLMLLSGLLTYVIPGGSYERIEVDGVLRIVEGSFTYTGEQGIAPLHWVLSPILQLAVALLTILLLWLGLQIGF